MREKTHSGKQLTLGSLFDGIGGFPLAAVLSGVTPVWAAEIEPFCIAVTKERFPNMQHLGSVTDINGANIPPVDIITFGSPCQDLSVAGKRAGLKHTENGDDETTRSGLFVEAIRIIYEMRNATNGKYPKYIVWENVPGAFSSNKGYDFKTVLEEITKTDIPMPASGKWSNAGVVRSGGITAAWRQLDAQYWGVPQRRKRIYLIGSFGSDNAAEILFKRDSVQRYLAPRGAEGEEIAGGTGNGIETASRVLDARGNGNGYIVPTMTGDHNGRVTDYTALVYGFSYRAGAKSGSVAFGEQAPTLSASRHDASVICIQGNTIGREPQNGGNGLGLNIDVCPTLNTADRHAVAYNDACFGVDCRNGAISTGLYPTLQAKPNGGWSLNYSSALTYQDVVGALCARDYKGADNRHVNGNKLIIETAHDCRYNVRRLTPLECERLQGYPDGWTLLREKDKLDGAEYDFWRDVMITDKKMRGKKYNTHSAPEQLLKWYNGLECDAARYKALGNSLAIPCALRVIGYIAEHASEVEE